MGEVVMFLLGAALVGLGIGVGLVALVGSLPSWLVIGAGLTVGWTLCRFREAYR